MLCHVNINFNEVKLITFMLFYAFYGLKKSDEVGTIKLHLCLKTDYTTIFRGKRYFFHL